MTAQHCFHGIFLTLDLMAVIFDAPKHFHPRIWRHFFEDMGISAVAINEVA
jgi:hypothetical protein